MGWVVELGVPDATIDRIGKTWEVLQLSSNNN
jgi:hypothetical protein